MALEAWKLLGIGLMVLIWVSYQLTPLMYNIIEEETGVLLVEQNAEEALRVADRAMILEGGQTRDRRPPSRIVRPSSHFPDPSTKWIRYLI